MEFKDAFDKLLSDSRLSLKQLSKEIDIDERLLELYLKGDAKPDNSDKRIIANYFNVDLDEMLKQEITIQDKIKDPKYLLANRILTFITIIIPFLYIIFSYINLFLFETSDKTIIDVSIISVGNLNNNFCGSVAFYFCLINLLLAVIITILDYLTSYSILKINITKVLPILRICNYVLIIINLFLIFFAINYAFYYVI